MFNLHRDNVQKTQKTRNKGLHSSPFRVKIKKESVNNMTKVLAEVSLTQRGAPELLHPCRNKPDLGDSSCLHPLGSENNGTEGKKYISWR